MGNARSASYSYHHPLEQQEDRSLTVHRSLPSPLQQQHHYHYQGAVSVGVPVRAESSPRQNQKQLQQQQQQDQQQQQEQHYPPYWNDVSAPAINNQMDAAVIMATTTTAAATTTNNNNHHRNGGGNNRRNSISTVETTSSFTKSAATAGTVGCSSGDASEPLPLPFVRHRNAPIRLPRININKESWPHHQFGQPFGYTLNKRGRHKSLSCSMMHHDRPTSAKSTLPPPPAFMARLQVNSSAMLNDNGGLRAAELLPTPPPTTNDVPPPPRASLLSLRDNIGGVGEDDDDDDEDRAGVPADQSGRLRAAVSCAALLTQCDSSELRIDRSATPAATARCHPQPDAAATAALRMRGSSDRDLASNSITNCNNNNSSNNKERCSTAREWKANLNGASSHGGSSGSLGSPFLRRQFLSMRSYQEHRPRRPLLPTRSCSVRPSPSLSVPVLTEPDSQFQYSGKVKSYLALARLKKQSVERSLSRSRQPSSSSVSADDYCSGDVSQPSASPAKTTLSSSLNEDGPFSLRQQHHQQLQQQQQKQKLVRNTGANRSATNLHKSWTSISQESLGVGGDEEEDEDGGYTTTLTVGDNGSLRSRFSDSSYLTLLTANTSLSSGYHGPASLGDPHPVSSSCSEDDLHHHQQPHMMMASHCDGGTTSGLFYLEWLRQVTGTLPSYVELRQGRLHLKLIQDDVMEHIDGAVKVSEITELLRAEYGIVTGGRSREGRPIITFPDRCNFATLTEDNYRKLIVYLTSVPALHDADLGYVLIVDRRSDRWNAVKATLLRLSSFFPGLIAVVYVLRPSGLLQKAISEVSNKFFREDFKFKVVVCSCLDELHQRIDSNQLTTELGGYMYYDHQEWIDTRVAVESFSANTADIGAALRKFSRRLQDTELPNDVQSTQAVLQHQGQEYANLKTELRNANTQGETLLDLIKKPAPSASGRRCEPWPGQLVNITTVERLLVQMEETQRTLDEFWNKHASHLKLCLQLRQFELDFRELQIVLNEDIQTVSGFETDGDSVAVIDALLQQTFDCRSRYQLDLDRADALYSHASKLMADYADSPVVLDSVRPKSIELQRMSQTLRELFIQRLDALERSRDLYYRIEKANRWCSQGVDLLASQQLEKCASPEFASQALTDIEEFLASANEFRDPKEFRSLFQDIITPETKSLINQVIQRLQDVQVMCDRRTVGLRQIVIRARAIRPIQTVPPEPSSIGRKESTPSESNNISMMTTTTSTAMSANVKVRHVLTELLETERVYVNEISIVLKGYRDQLVDPDPYQSVPLQLAEKADVLFGNLPEICAFHSQILLPDLESSLSSPQLVASCFLRHTEDLHSLYSFYCQNIPQSEELRRQVGEQNNPFLRQCQTNLGHKLPLSAYLLKPVQRITKYQLLLKDLMKYCQCGLSEDVSRENDLQLALDAMLAVLRCVNDSMHQVAITGYQGSLAELGRLLLQGGFSVWAEGKRDRLRELRLKPMQRHVFLYERGVVLCKRVGKDPDKATYQFKHVLKMSEVGLTETVHSGKGSDARKFELWLKGRHEVWVLQAPARDVKETWITEIKRVLLNQFHQLKGQTMQTTTTTRASAPSSMGAGGSLATPASGTPKAIQHSSSIPNGASHPSSPFGPKSLRPTSSCSSWEYNSSTAGSSSSSSSGVSSAGDRSSIVDTSASSTTSRASSGSRMLRSATVDEDDGWSTDFSLSDEDMGESYLDHVEPLRRRYVVLADYAPLGPTEAGLREGDIVDLVRVGCAGWWYVRPSSVGNSTSQEGWAPSAYLEMAPVPAIKSPCSSGTPSPSVSSQDSEHDHLQ